jgi:hypothetical protein
MYNIKRNLNYFVDFLLVLFLHCIFVWVIVSIQVADHMKVLRVVQSTSETEFKYIFLSKYEIRTEDRDRLGVKI